MPKNVLTEKNFCSPFTPSYWKAAVLELKNIRTLAVVSMLLAVSVVIGAYARIPIPFVQNLYIMFDFLPNALAAAIGGPVIALIYGFAGDIISYLMNPWGAYFPGYTLSLMLVMLVFSLFFYRRKISIWRIVVSKLLYNAFINVLLGSLWSAMQFEKGYLVYFWSSLTKNSILFPIEVFMLMIVFGAMIPPMARLRLIPQQQTIAIPSIKKLLNKEKPDGDAESESAQ